MKAIILTYAPVSKADAKLLKNTDVFKIATNFSAAELKPNIRLTADNIVDKCLECDTCPVLSINYDLDKERVINACKMPARHSSLISCIDYLLFAGYKYILLVATNPEGTATFNINYNGVNELKDYVYLFKYTQDGNFNIPYKSIKDFIMLTDEEKLLGVTENSPKKLMSGLIFTDSCKFEVWTEGKDNKSIETGELIKNILPLEEREKFTNGAVEICYNGTCIKMVTEFKKVEAPKQQEEEIVKPKAKAKTTKKRTK